MPTETEIGETSEETPVIKGEVLRNTYFCGPGCFELDTYTDEIKGNNLSFVNKE